MLTFPIVPFSFFSVFFGSAVGGFCGDVYGFRAGGVGVCVVDGVSGYWGGVYG